MTTNNRLAVFMFFTGVYLYMGAHTEVEDPGFKLWLASIYIFASILISSGKKDD